MKGKIGSLGSLYIERGGLMVIADCKYNEGVACSHRCAHFGNPERGDMDMPCHWTLELCDGKKLVFEEFIDERVNDQKIIHGINCKKEPHIRTGYLHADDDDSPYRVDGCYYCGRCHRSLDSCDLKEIKNNADRQTQARHGHDVNFNKGTK